MDTKNLDLFHITCIIFLKIHSKEIKQFDKCICDLWYNYFHIR